MNLSIIVYAAALYMLGGHRMPEIRNIAHGLALCWTATLLIWLASDGEISSVVLIPVRTVFAVLIMAWVATPLARMVGFAALPILAAYIMVELWPDHFGHGLINFSVFLQLSILAWGAWGDGLGRFVFNRYRNRLLSHNRSHRVSGPDRKSEGVDQ